MTRISKRLDDLRARFEAVRRTEGTEEPLYPWTDTRPSTLRTWLFTVAFAPLGSVLLDVGERQRKSHEEAGLAIYWASMRLDGLLAEGKHEEAAAFLESMLAEAADALGEPRPEPGRHAADLMAVLDGREPGHDTEERG